MEVINAVGRRKSAVARVYLSEGTGKIIINKVAFTDNGFMDTMTNGLVVDVENNTPLIKTQNGVIALVDCHTEGILAVGDVLGSNVVENQFIRPAAGRNT